MNGLVALGLAALAVAVLGLAAGVIGGTVAATIERHAALESTAASARLSARPYWRAAAIGSVAMLLALLALAALGIIGTLQAIP